jgi:hypothetical protein
MFDLEAIRSAVSNNDYLYTAHALIRLTERHISRVEIEEVIAAGEIIEEYPDDKYGPTCLLYGKASGDRHLHVLLSVPPVKIITAYEPNPDEWEAFRVRKTEDE